MEAGYEKRIDSLREEIDKLRANHLTSWMPKVPKMHLSRRGSRFYFGLQCHMMTFNRTKICGSYYKIENHTSGDQNCSCILCTRIEHTNPDSPSSARGTKRKKITIGKTQYIEIPMNNCPPDTLSESNLPVSSVSELTGKNIRESSKQLFFP